MFNDKSVKDSFVQTKMWGNENLYFMGGYKFSYVIINRTDFGIGVLPIEIIPGDLVLNPQTAWFLPNDEIDSVVIKKSFMAIKVIISTNTKKQYTFVVEHKNLRLEQHEQNFIEFISQYS